MHGGEVVGQDGASSTVKEVEGLIKERKVLSILRMRDLMAWLQGHGEQEKLKDMKWYCDKYGLK